MTGSAHALRAIRDTEPPSSRATAKGGLIAEAFRVFNAVASGLPAERVRSEVVDGALLQKTSIQTRRSVWMALRHRYFSSNPYVLESLAAATRFGRDSVEFRSLAYLYYALRDRAVFEFVTGPVWQKWQSGAVSVTPGDFFAFVEGLAGEHPAVKKWKESTRIRLGRNIFAALRDFGLLTGIRTKRIQQPAVPAETLFHLLSVLDAEGKRGAAVLAAPDWRLFLLSESQVAEHLLELSRRGWIRFERTGRVVILELVRALEVG